MTDIKNQNNLGEATKLLRNTYNRTNAKENSEALFLTSSFVFDSAQEGRDLFSGAIEGNFYSRFTNPNIDSFVHKLMVLEGADAGLGFASGMAAITACCLAFLEAGDQVVLSRDIFGTSTNMLQKYFCKFGVKVSVIDGLDLASWQNAITPKTKFFYLESPSNPLGKIFDLEAIAKIAHKSNVKVIVDNALVTAALQKPLKFKADLSLYSATKFVDGQGRVIGGAVVGDTELCKELGLVLRNTGASLSPFNAWVLSKSLETLNLRMQAHSKNALEIAEFLETHPKIAKVHYAYLPSSPYYALAKKQQKSGGGIISFEVQTANNKALTKEETLDFINQTASLLSLTGNFGDTKTAITHPTTTTHFRLEDKEKKQAGIFDNLVRISVGLEDVVDIKSILNKALEKA